MTSTAVVVTDAPDAARYEARLNGDLAGILDYRRLTRRIALIHTEVLPGFEGRGIGGALARHALDAARAEGIGVTPICAFVASYLDRHPDDQDLITWGRPATP